MNTKFKSIVTGAILEPNSEMVAEQLRKNPSFVVYDGQEAAQGDEKPLSKMNKDELLKVAQDAEIAVPDGATKAEIVEYVKRMEHFISSAFIINSTHMLCQAGRISKRIQVLCDALLLHPILVLRKSKMVVGSMEVGGFSHTAKKYIRKVLQETRTIDRRILIITYSGLDEKKLQYIQSLARQYCTFERVYLQKASAAVVSNCGPEAFGLLFMRKDESAAPAARAGKQNGAA